MYVKIVQTLNNSPEAFTIQEKVINVPITSVVLGGDPRDPNNEILHMFHCIACGDKVGQYKGFAYSVGPGITPMPLPWIQQCDRCKAKYGINAII